MCHVYYGALSIHVVITVVSFTDLYKYKNSIDTVTCYDATMFMYWLPGRSHPDSHSPRKRLALCFIAFHHVSLGSHAPPRFGRDAILEEANRKSGYIYRYLFCLADVNDLFPYLVLSTRYSTLYS
jgi:hypothetical protein